jgi:hypothetical protein
MIIPKQNEIILVYSLLFYTPQKNLQMQSNVIWIKQLNHCVLLPSTVSKQSHRHMRNFVLPAGLLSGCRIHQLNFIEPADQSSMKQEHAHHRPQMSCLSRIHKPSSSSNQGDWLSSTLAKGCSEGVSVWKYQSKSKHQRSNRRTTSPESITDTKSISSDVSQIREVPLDHYKLHQRHLLSEVSCWWASHKSCVLDDNTKIWMSSSCEWEGTLLITK